MKPIIGIIGRSDSKDDISMIKVNDNIRKSIISCGGIPLLILPTQLEDYSNTYPRDMNKMTYDNKFDLVKQLELCDGIIMPGGKEIFEYDRFVCEYCICANKPILGICLGMQVMSYYNREYSLMENDEGGLNHSSKERYAHSVYIYPNTKLFSIVKASRFMVNSRHKFHADSIGNYIVCATSPDGLIEAIEYPYNLFNIGVEWHPEDLMDDEYNRRIFKALINNSIQKKT
jgi:gamma-glutamyl-gamma-aminobutyrate hydrolase PuuD